MLLRTSSSPISQAILSQSVLDCPPKRDLFSNTATAACSAVSPCSAPAASPPRCHLSCAKPNMNSPKFNRNPFRRALSDSNLEDLASPVGLSSAFSSSCSSFAPFFHKPPEGPKMGKNLETAPSFGIYQSGDGFDSEVLEEEKKKSKYNEGRAKGEGGLMAADGEDGELERTVTIGASIEPIDAMDFSFGKPNMGLIVEEDEEENDDEVFDSSVSPPMYLATGLGADIVAGGGVDHPLSFEDGEDAETHYKNMVAEYPNNPLLLRNYAELLKSKGDFEGAGEYYFRATLADPEDGEVLAQYAKLVWEVYHDQERADEYFERAAKASSQNSHVLAAWASFLWETAVESSQTQDNCNQNKEASEELSVEEYYQRLIEQNPSNSMVLRNYAYFLYRSKRDLHGAEEYYLRAILVDPADGEILSQYANLVWELYKDEHKAQSYFQRATQLAPENSNVLAAYASFLWATDRDEGEQQDPMMMSSVHLPQVVALQA